LIHELELNRSEDILLHLWLVELNIELDEDLVLHALVLGVYLK
jgi:hypothetical protein